MPGSFDLEKLQRLVEGQRAAAASLRGANERLRDTRDEVRRLRDILMRDAGTSGARTALEERMRAPLEELARMTSEELTSYTAMRGGERVVFDLGVNVQTFNKFIRLRESLARLERVVEKQRTELDRFAIIPGLLVAINGWGFNQRDLVGD